jgi:hypothetical protein
VKAQASLITKGIYLIIALVAISIFFYQIFSFSSSSKAIESETNFVEKAVTLLDVISTSSTCLGYTEENELNIPISSVAHKTIDVNKIEEFSQKYKDIEPPCARDYENGYEIVVRMFGSDLDTTKRCYKLQEKVWRFGSLNFSEGDALRNVIEVSLPVSIRLNASYQQPGEIRIKLVDGELEEFSGAINKVCNTGISIRKRMSFSYPTYTNQNSVCQEMQHKLICRKISCPATSQKFESGSYEIVLNKNGDIVEIK